MAAAQQVSSEEARKAWLTLAQSVGLAEERGLPTWAENGFLCCGLEGFMVFSIGRVASLL